MTHRLPIVALWLSLASTGAALTVQLDYTYDTYFSTNQTAKAALEKAAADIGAVIGGTLGAVPTDTFTGTSGSTTATADWKLTFSKPSDGTQVTLDPFSFSANTFRIYVGMRPLSGTTLGQGGPAGAGVSIGGSGFPSDWVSAVNNMQTASNAAMKRGSGPIMGSLSGSVALGGTQANYDLKYGALVGSLVFDNDSNNDGFADSASLLNSYWQFDATTSVGAGKNDLYSVALHEILHTLGFGTADTWDSLHNGTTWLGTHADALNGGSGAGLLSSGEDHILDGKMSLRLSDHALQECVMDPSLTTGTRKSLTELDVAFLQDLGYTVVPEPSSLGLLACGLVVLPWRRRQRF